MIIKLKQNMIAICIIVVSFAIACLFQIYGNKTYSRYNSENVHYNRGTVIEILDESITYDKISDSHIGSQKIKVLMKDGKFKNKEIELSNNITKTHQVLVKKGMDIIVNVDAPKNLKPYFTVYNYNRILPIVFSTACLLFAIFMIGKEKGIKAVIGLVYCIFLVAYILLPMVFSGLSPILISMSCIILATIVTLLLLNGKSKKTLAAILSTVIGISVSLVFFQIIAKWMHIDGFSSSEAEGLLLIAEETGLNVKNVLFVGIMISSLGAVMDVCMSIVSAVYEVRYHNQGLGFKELFRSGIEIGKDMIGTMCNTLILAFTGSSFVTLLVFASYQIEFTQFINSNFFAIEFAQGICGTLGIVLSVPIASGFSAYFLCKE